MLAHVKFFEPSFVITYGELPLVVGYLAVVFCLSLHPYRLAELFPGMSDVLVGLLIGALIEWCVARHLHISMRVHYS